MARLFALLSALMLCTVGCEHYKIVVPDEARRTPCVQAADDAHARCAARCHDAASLVNGCGSDCDEAQYEQERSCPGVRVYKE